MTMLTKEQLDRFTSFAHADDGERAALYALIAERDAANARADAIAESFMNGEHDCAVCGRVTANGTCTQCRHGDSPLLVERARADLAEAQLSDAHAARDRACAEAVRLREAMLSAATDIKGAMGMEYDHHLATAVFVRLRDIRERTHAALTAPESSAWLEAHDRDLLERVADRVCDEYPPDVWTPDSDFTCRDIAESIRSLATAPSAPASGDEKTR